MRLKEIKPGMAIHCKNDDEKKALLEEAERLGYVWYRTKGKPTERSVHDIGDTIHFYDAGTNSFSADYKHITHSCQICNTEFSDLIIPDPELSAEEALLAYDQMCKENYCCNDCPIYGIVGHECAHKMDEHITEIVDAIKKWKADREKKGPETEKKEPEIEWFWKSYAVGRSDYKEADTEQEAMEWCEYYVKEHPEAKCIYKRVCRVKAVE